MSSSYPLTEVSETKFIEGYWRLTKKRAEPTGDKIKDRQQSYPFPKDSGEDVDEDFIEKMEKIINMSSHSKEKKIDRKGNITISLRRYKGYSTCRLCDKDDNGSCEYTILKDEKEYTFPEGIVHYYKKHDVQPSDEFYTMIMKIDLID